MGERTGNWRKSSYSGNGGEACIEIASWRKSSYSANGGEQCVETADSNGVILVRDTTNRDGGTLTFATGAWATFTASLKH